MTTIGDYALYDSDINNLVISKSLTQSNIGTGAFLVDGANSYTYCGTADLTIAGFQANNQNQCPGSPILALSNVTLSATVGGALDTYTVANTGGPADNYYIFPALNNGTLTFDHATGLISGTPDTEQNATSYTVTAGNASGDDSVAISISVNGSGTPPPPLPSPPGPTTISTPDSSQRSRIYGVSPASVLAGVATPMIIAGSFIETITSIQIDGVPITRNSWTQTSKSLRFVLPAQVPGRREIQIFNGSVPVLQAQRIYISATAMTDANSVETSTATNGSASLSQPKTPTNKPAAKPTVPAKPKVSPKSKPTVKSSRKTSLLKPGEKVVNVQCFKGKELFIAHGVKPQCPKGFTIKKIS